MHQKGRENNSNNQCLQEGLFYGNESIPRYHVSPYVSYYQGQQEKEHGFQQMNPSANSPKEENHRGNQSCKYICGNICGMIPPDQNSESTYDQIAGMKQKEQDNGSDNNNVYFSFQSTAASNGHSTIKNSPKRNKIFGSGQNSIRLSTNLPNKSQMNRPLFQHSPNSEQQYNFLKQNLEVLNTDTFVSPASQLSIMGQGVVNGNGNINFYPIEIAKGLRISQGFENQQQQNQIPNHNKVTLKDFILTVINNEREVESLRQQLAACTSFSKSQLFRTLSESRDQISLENIQKQLENEGIPFQHQDLKNILLQYSKGEGSNAGIRLQEFYQMISPKTTGGKQDMQGQNQKQVFMRLINQMLNGENKAEAVRKNFVISNHDILGIFKDMVGDKSVSLTKEKLQAYIGNAITTEEASLIIDRIYQWTPENIQLEYKKHVSICPTLGNLRSKKIKDCISEKAQQIKFQGMKILIKKQVNMNADMQPLVQN